MSEIPGQFEQRKQDHIRIALDSKSQAQGLGSLDSIQLIHEALPEISFDNIKIGSEVFSRKAKCPIFISSMTAGHAQALPLNLILAKAAQQRGWMMGVGSQRRELNDSSSAAEWKEIRKQAPEAILIGNLGLAQVIQTPVVQIQKLVNNLQAQALFVHTNPLQEVLQKEGNLDFRGGMKALEKLTKELGVPVILKEVGCGFSAATLERLIGKGLYAVDVAGLGGTHWGRIEGYRAEDKDWQKEAAQTFADWGIPGLESVLSAKRFGLDYQIWASGGVRSGLDAAKLIAVGAQFVGIAQPFLATGLKGESAVLGLMERLENELKIALFCTGCENLSELRQRKVWKWKSMQESSL